MVTPVNPPSNDQDALPLESVTVTAREFEYAFALLQRGDTVLGMALSVRNPDGSEDQALCEPHEAIDWFVDHGLTRDEAEVFVVQGVITLRYGPDALDQLRRE